MKRQTRRTEAHPRMWSFGYLLQGMVSACLLFVMLFLPLAPVFADTETLSDQVNEEVVDSQEHLQEEVVHEVSDDTQESSAPAQDIESVPEDTLTTEQIPVQVDEGEIFNTALLESESVDSETSGAQDTDAQSNTDTSDILPAHDQSGSESEEGYEHTDVQEDDREEYTSDAENEDTESFEHTDSEEGDDAAEYATTTTEVVSAHTVTTDENRYSFSKNECTVVGDGSFYCARSDTTPEVVNTDRIFAAADAEGDKEIFLEREGKIVSFTDNQVDDDAPFYDAVSDSVVWHRLIQDRYQIVEYVLDTAEEKQLTKTAYNNMEPSRHGDATVWQAWVSNGWEIMLYEDGVLTQLTDNAVPDIAPSINKNYIVWQSQEGGVWYAKVYDRTTGDIETIENAEGLSIENARFVLVYDTKHENGDIETRGYDLKDKRSIPLSAAPSPVPDTIPEPDQTGEDRALVQSLIQLKPKTGEDEPMPDEQPTPDTLDSTPEPETATSTIPDLILDEEDVPYEVIETDPVEHISELVIPDIATTETSHQDTAHIEDVVIPPYIPEPAGDPQEDVASGA